MGRVGEPGGDQIICVGWVKRVEGYVVAGVGGPMERGLCWDGGDEGSDGLGWGLLGRHRVVELMG